MTSVSVMRFHMVSEDHRGQRIKSGLCLISVNQTSAYSWRGEKGEPPVGHGEALFALSVLRSTPFPRGACSTLLRPAVGLSRVV